MDKITTVEINEHYGDTMEALEDNGYEEAENELVTKKGKYYKIANVNKFNTWIYDIKLEEVEK
ncbi:MULTISPECIES: hypothetical protein [Clostridium]|jgi:hypothetical protein|uniref:hypothetical protein n=1 Tax=Clostridium TaxID=1485 RepID=UPI000289183A|nr:MULTISPECIES: hypothetical protein [Clostridium]MDF2504439.1 hypothetical protein [Clostridium sp.]